ncbi:MAG TPA: hypothetical protein VNZ86_05165 [Bacteroidia bacterium]|jgi:hypothetical protein|nr:hypothetical protein [Bacteroidia bacterium]
MKKPLLLLLPFALLMVSCGGGKDKETKTIPSKQSKPNPHEVLLKTLQHYDTLTPGGYALHYSLDSADQPVITLSHKKFHRIFPSYAFTQPGTYVYKNEWKHFIGLRNTCGSTCWTLTLLPLGKQGQITHYDFDISSDTKNELVFGKKTYEGSEYYVANIRTGRKKKIVLKDIAGQGLPGNGIDSVAFVKEGIYIKWKCLAGKKEKEETFKLKI